MMKPGILLLYLIAISGSSDLQAQSRVSFFEEHIDFVLDDKYFSINGIYSFFNDADRTTNQQIIFPFAAKISLIDSISVIHLKTYKKIQFKRLENAISFNFILMPKDTVDIHIFYRQKTSTTNKYIITSTQSWGKPLETAVYTLTTAKNQKIRSFSYAADAVRETNETKLYFWEKHQFMPKFDFEITIDR